MKKVLYLLTVVIIGIVGVLGFDKYSTNYGRLTSKYEQITLNKVDNLNDGDIVYVGRKTCPYCRKFVPKLSMASNRLEKKIYYIDTDLEKERSRYDLEKFIKDYNISGIPTLIKKSNEKLVIKNVDESISIEKLEKIIMEE